VQLPVDLENLVAECNILIKHLEGVR
jgi:hypothetical protein